MPGAVNRPVLSDEERARVGTLYKQVSAFNGRKIGAALVSRNIAHHIEDALHRTAESLAPAGLLLARRQAQRRDGAHSARDRLGRAPPRRRLQGLPAHRGARAAGACAPLSRCSVVCGLTGSGKSRLLEHTRTPRRAGARSRALAAHRGSVLGNLPDSRSRRRRCSRAASGMRCGASTRRGRYSWSRRANASARCTSRRLDGRDVGKRLRAARDRDGTARRVAARASTLISSREPAALGVQLDCLMQLHGHAVIERWKQMAQRRLGPSGAGTARAPLRSGLHRARSSRTTRGLAAQRRACGLATPRREFRWPQRARCSRCAVAPKMYRFAETADARRRLVPARAARCSELSRSVEASSHSRPHRSIDVRVRPGCYTSPPSRQSDPAR